MKKQNDHRIIQAFIELLKEEDLYNPIRSLLMSKGYDVWIVHGSHERGKDIIATKNKDHNLLVSVKRGDIDQRRWKTEVHPGLDELMMRSIQHTNVDETLPRKPLLVFSGSFIGSVDQMISEFNTFYQKKGEPQLEVWDINKLVNEFSDHLLSIDLVGGDFLEDLQRLILSISNNDVNQKYAEVFITEHLSLEDNKFLGFRLAMLYVLRKAQDQNNFYAFFKFAEIALVKMWSLLHNSDDVLMLEKFDDLHNIYFHSLEEWIGLMEDTLKAESGLFDFTTNGTLEIVTYQLRTFDAIRRLSYLAYLHILKKDKEEANSYAEKLLRLITNNRVSLSPICEFNYTDIGLALTVLVLTKHESQAALWLYNMIDFLVSHYSLGYAILPIGKGTDEIFDNVIFKEKPPIRSNIESCLFPLLLEFTIVLDAPEIFKIFSNRIQNLVQCYEILMPADKEDEIYQQKVINSTYRSISIPYSWEAFKFTYPNLIRTAKRNFSPLRCSRPFVFVLVANIYRDRYFPDLWRHIFFQ